MLLQQEVHRELSPPVEPSHASTCVRVYTLYSLDGLQTFPGQPEHRQLRMPTGLSINGTRFIERLTRGTLTFSCFQARLDHDPVVRPQFNYPCNRGGYSDPNYSKICLRGAHTTKVVGFGEVSSRSFYRHVARRLHSSRRRHQKKNKKKVRGGGVCCLAFYSVSVVLRAAFITRAIFETCDYPSGNRQDVIPCFGDFRLTCRHIDIPARVGMPQWGTTCTAARSKLIAKPGPQKVYNPFATASNIPH